ncbi:MAG: DUF1311 domain-containing protein, partial [Deinococcus-Thermus bacterium]|nr:DUF1311 domain-containing protein [Deinococcota bacterium]
AGSAAEEAVCADETLAALDRRLAVVWREALAAARGVADADTAVPRLRAEQRGWIKGRDDCWKAQMGLAACVEAAYRDRVAELQAAWMLVAAAPPVFYRCDDRSEVVVTVMASDTPTARLERGDTTVVAWRRPAADGVRYVGPFGLTFHAQDGDAEVAWDPYAPPLICRRVD